MISLVFFITVIVMAIRSFLAIRKESSLFVEFHQKNKLLILTVLLYPLGALVVSVGEYLLPRTIVFVSAILCFLPGLLISRKITNALDCAGTDRVKMAKEAASPAFLGAMVGLIYLVALLAVSIVANSLSAVARVYQLNAIRQSWLPIIIVLMGG